MAWLPLTDEGVGGPGAWWAGAADEAALSDLEEAERPRGVRSTVAADLCKVVDDRAVVAIGPGVPLQLQGVTSLDGYGVGRRFRGFVACDVRCTKVVRLDKT